MENVAGMEGNGYSFTLQVLVDFMAATLTDHHESPSLQNPDDFLNGQHRAFHMDSLNAELNFSSEAYSD